MVICVTNVLKEKKTLFFVHFTTTFGKCPKIILCINYVQVNDTDLPETVCRLHDIKHKNEKSKFSKNFGGILCFSKQCENVSLTG